MEGQSLRDGSLPNPQAAAFAGDGRPTVSRRDEVFVTGGLGFIGSFVADAYLTAGRRVTIIDSEVGSVTDGREYDAHPRCTVMRASVQKFLESGGTFTNADRVIHAGAPVGPARLLGSSGRIGEEIVRSTSLVLEACLESDVPLCVFSSAEVYGFSGKLGERDDIRVPTRYNARIEYAIAKTLTEAMTINSINRGLRGIIIRPFNVAGPRQSRAGGFVMPTFVQQALANRPITVFGNGQQVRAFLAASDLSRFLIDFMDAALVSPDRIFNLGNPANTTTMRGLAERVSWLLASTSPIVHVDPKTIHGPMYREAESFEKVPVLQAATALGWEPLMDLDALILATADFYSSRRDWRGADAPI
jgi:nucleoside-diphosphate-sugar epimerase